MLISLYYSFIENDYQEKEHFDLKYKCYFIYFLKIILFIGIYRSIKKKGCILF